MKYYKRYTPLIVIMVVAMLGSWLLLRPTAAAPVTPTPEPTLSVLTNEDVPELARLINQDRTDAGLPPLIEDGRLEAAAQAHCDDMVRLNEWGHYLSDGTNPQTFILAQVPNTKWTGENTTWGWNTPKYVNDKLMASPEHKLNILYPNYTAVGYAICKTDKYPNIMVQEFAGL